MRLCYNTDTYIIRGISILLSFINFSKTYKGGKKAVDDLSLTVEAGDIYGFIGHNGAGKTTSLKAAAGILSFSEGEIRINGMSIKEHPVECKKLMAYIPDNPDVYEFMTGIKYLNFIADMYGVGAERNADIEKYAATFEIKEALISALIHHPKLLLLDEPFVGLDPKAAHILKTLFKEMTESGAAIFFSTHVLEVAEKLCNKIAIIKEGRLVASGDTESVIGGDSSLEELFLELNADE